MLLFELTHVQNLDQSYIKITKCNLYRIFSLRNPCHHVLSSWYLSRRLTLRRRNTTTSPLCYLNYFPSLLPWLPLYNKNVTLSISLCYSRLAWNELLLPLKDLFLRANFYDPRTHLPHFMFSTVFVNNPSKWEQVIRLGC